MQKNVDDDELSYGTSVQKGRLGWVIHSQLLNSTFMPTQTKILIYLLPSWVRVCQANGPKIIQPTTEMYHFVAVPLFVVLQLEVS